MSSIRFAKPHSLSYQAQTFTAALAAVQEKAGSRAPVLGYTVPYAVSNILLTVCGSLIVALVT